MRRSSRRATSLLTPDGVRPSFAAPPENDPASADAMNAAPP
ncbi:MAG TPA: hypothetical protein VIF62_15685 [Labilithrix sp.]